MKYKPIDQSDLEFFRSVCDPARVIPRAEVGEDYAHDEMPVYGQALPEVLIEAMSAQEISDILTYCYAHNIPVTPRGAGTGLCGGAVPICGGVLLCTIGMNKILEIDTANMTATVQPGVLLMELSAAALEQDLFYPPEPGEKSATLGGNVMTNAGGMKAVKYGVTRDYVMGMDVVLPDGRMLTLGGKLAKSSSGYSLLHLFVGSEGTLGIVTQLVLRLIPKPCKAISMLVPFPTLRNCIDAVPDILKSGLQPVAVEFIQREVIEASEKYLGKRFPDKTSDAYLLVSFDAASQREVEEKCDSLAQLCIGRGAIDAFFADTPERMGALWEARGAFLEAIKCSTPDLDECDVVVPRTRISDFVLYMAQLEQQHGIRIRYFGHAGDGNIHVYVCKDDLPDDEWKAKLAVVMQKLYDKSVALEGKVSGEHGIGHAKVEFLRESEGDLYMELCRRVKVAFDPKGLLNPGKVVGQV